jgi:protein-S-isoprenylcysteine O-methyltransferase Ste14
VPTAAARTFAWAGAGFFAISLLYFLFTYFVTFGETPTAEDGAIAWDIALFTIFALHHSLFAREHVRVRVTRLAGPLERSVYVWIASVLFIVVCAAWKPVSGVAWRIDGIAAWALRALQVLGIWLTLRGAAVIDAFDLAGIRQVQRAGSPERAPEFKTTGPYGWIRHPIYAGWFIVVLAMPTMTMSRLVFAVTSCAYLLIAIPLEERSLRRTTAGAYDAYARKVRWKLIPGVLGWWMVVGGW